uniref:G-protein coupled receptors family 1 profile domain-containing protein n=1 Tax=Odontella aurita TaxID=265563 RepID=A0A7S4JN43_9STRA|mmetsp:Transcript_50157/g.150988  ORF Transcript_50157/g.150988 Transcript_50157/m.150988 type:complete len:306 (+) Transcript_50157:213-1130(+)
MAFSLNILLLIRYGWTQRKFERKIERWMHPTIFVLAVLYTSIPLFYGGYNPYCGVCDLVPMPFWCGDWIFGDGSECVRGSPAVANVIWIVWFVGIGGMVLFCTVAIFMVYFGVRSTEKRSAMYRPYTASRDRESKRIRGTMLMYTIGLYVFWVVPVFILLIPQAFSIYWLSLWYYFLYPLQGFYNFLVFSHPKCKKYQRRHPGTWLTTAYLRIVFPPTKIRKTRQLFMSSPPLDSATVATEGGDDGIGFNSFNKNASKEEGNEGGASEIAPKVEADHEPAVDDAIGSTIRLSVESTRQPSVTFAI